MLTIRHPLTIFLAIHVAVLANGPAPASAGDSDSGQEADASESGQEGDERLAELPTFRAGIVVTAQKREENAQKVPISMTAFSDVDVDWLGIETPVDFVARVPNVHIANGFTVGNANVTIRGVSQVNNADPSVALVIDGVYLPNQKQLMRELFDVERIEVLKGPQGALYGRNALGGAFNIVTREPGDDLEGHVEVQIGNGSRYGVSGAASGALVPGKLRFRAAGSFKDSDGLIDNTFLRTEADAYRDVTGRLRLYWLPSDSATVDVRVSRSDTEGGAVLYSLFPTDGFANDFSFPPDESILGFSERTMNDFSVRVSWSTDAFTLTSITALSDVEEGVVGDGDLSNPERESVFFPFGQLAQQQDLDLRMWSQEVRLTSPDDQPVTWIGGVYHLATDRALTSNAFADTTGEPAGFIPLFAAAEDNDNTAYAVFGQVGFRIGEGWRVDGALRFDRDEREQLDLSTGAERAATYDAWQPRVAVSYSPNEDLTAFFAAGSGFRSGGFNAPTVTPRMFRKETSRNFELGVKSAFLDRRVRLNGSAYVTMLDGAQHFLFDALRGGQIIDNIRDVEVFGFEADLAAQVAPGVEAYAAFGYNDAEIQDFDGSGRFIGNQAPNNTRWQASLGAQYARLLTERLLGMARLDAELRGRQYWHADNLDVQDSLQLLNARFVVESSEWAVSVWGKNLTDEPYYVEYADAAWVGIPSGDDIGHLGPPRSYGVDLRWKF